MDDTGQESVITGRNAVLEAVRSGREINKILILSGATEGSLRKIVAMAKERGIVVQETDRHRLDSLAEGTAHQGVVALAAAKAYQSVEEMLERAGEKGEPPLIVICDGINDPQNLGAILRTAEACGAHGVIIPKHRSVGLTAAAGKASAGAMEYIPVARVVNLAAAIEDLKARGLWVFGPIWRAESITRRKSFGAAGWLPGRRRGARTPCQR
jgi:23S rRNA (guanosine2251-2'-O)-methyltransferase